MYDPTDPYGIKQLMAQKAMLQPMQPGISGKITRVHGEAGVDALQMLPDTEVLALDETAPMVWVIKTDSAGYKGVKEAFDITPHKKAEVPDVKSMEERLAALETEIKAIKEGMKHESDC